MQALECSGKNWPTITVEHSFPGGAPESVDGRDVSEDVLAHINIGWTLPDGQVKNQIEICQDTRCVAIINYKWDLGVTNRDAFFNFAGVL